MFEENIFTVGGTVQANDGLYLPRKADEELLSIGKQGIFAYVLTARQMGKSSLMIHTAQRLVDEGVVCVIIDLTKIGTQVSPEQWYLGLLIEIEEQLELTTEVTEWWRQNANIGFTQRLALFLETILLAEIQCNVVIFVDEIDTTIGLNFTDDFFAAIRFVYNARAQIPKFKRLSFILLGVATPSDLIQDPQRTPFNIGKRVELTDFVYEEALPFLNGLSHSPILARQILEEVFKWTNGHPYLTQRLCQTISLNINDNGFESLPSENQAIILGDIVEQTFLGEKSEQDNNLQFVRDMLTKRAPDKEMVLDVYRSVRTGKKPVADEERSLIKIHLKLAGIVSTRGNVLRVRNAIYEKVFDERWISEHMPVNWPRIIQRLLLIVIVVFLLAPAPLAYLFWQERNEAKNQQKIINGKLLEEHARAAQGGVNLRGLLALEAIKQVPTYGAKTTLLEATYHLPELISESPPLAGEIKSSALSRDGRFLAVVVDNSIKVTDVSAGHEIMHWRIENDTEIKDISPDGLRLATFDPNKSELAIWDVSNHTILIKNQVSEYWFTTNNYSLSEDLRSIALIHQHNVDLWHENTGNQISSDELGYTPNQVTVSPMAEFVVCGGSKGSETFYEILVWNKTKNKLEKRARLVKKKSQKSKTNSSVDSEYKGFKPAISSGGNLIAVAFGQIISIFDQNGKTIASIEIDGIPEQVVFSNDEKLVAIVSSGEARIFELSKDTPERAHVKQSENISELTFDPKDTIFATSGENEAHAWSTTDGGELAQLIQDEGSSIISLSLRDDSFATLHADGSVSQWQIPRYPGEIQVKKSSEQDKDLPGVEDLAISPDGEHLAVALNDSTARIFDLATGFQEKKLEHKGVIYDVEYSPDGKMLATGGRNGKAYVWSRGAPKQPVLLDENGKNDIIKGITFDPFGKTVLTVGLEGKLAQWNKQTGKQVVKKEASPACDIFFNPSDKNMFATSNCYDNKIDIWDLIRLEKWQTFDSHSKEDVSGVVFSPDGRFLATSGWDKSARVWDIKTQKELSRANSKKYVNGLAFSADGQFLATASNDHYARIYEVKEGRIIKQPKLELPHDHRVHEVAFSPDARFLATSTWGGGVNIWDINSISPPTRPIELLQKGESVRDVVFSPGGHLMATAGNDKMARLFEVGSWRQVETYPLDFSGQAVAFSPDEKQLAVASGSGIATIWNVNTGAKIKEINGGNDFFDLKFSPDNQYFYLNNGGNAAVIWKAQGVQDNPVAVSAGYSMTSDVAFSSDSQFLHIIDSDTSTRSLHIASNNTESIHKASELSAPDLVAKTISHKRQYLAQIYEADQKNLKLIKFQSDQVLAIFEHKEPVEGPKFSFSDNHIAVIEGKKNIRIWDVPEKPMQKSHFQSVPLVHERNVSKVEFSSDDNFIATVDEDNIVRIWQLPEGEELARFAAEDAVSEIAFSPDSKNLGIGERNGKVTILKTKTADLIAQACRRLSRNLTWQEWKDNFGDEPYRRTCENRPVHDSVLEAAKNAAKDDDMEEAMRLFRHLKQLNADQNLEPEQEARKYGAIGLIVKAEKLLTEKENRFEDALTTIKNAQDRDPMVKIEAETYNRFCLFGTLRGYASKVLIDYCNKAVNMDKNNPRYRKSRGIARALLGDYPNALEDLNAYSAGIANNSEINQDVDLIRRWITDLNEKHNPFEETTVDEILNEEISNNYIEEL